MIKLRFSLVPALLLALISSCTTHAMLSNSFNTIEQQSLDILYGNSLPQKHTWESGYFSVSNLVYITNEKIQKEHPYTLNYYQLWLKDVSDNWQKRKNDKPFLNGKFKQRKNLSNEDILNLWQLSFDNETPPELIIFTQQEFLDQKINTLLIDAIKKSNTSLDPVYIIAANAKNQWRCFFIYQKCFKLLNSSNPDILDAIDQAIYSLFKPVSPQKTAPPTPTRIDVPLSEDISYDNFDSMLSSFMLPSNFFSSLDNHELNTLLQDYPYTLDPQPQACSLENEYHCLNELCPQTFLHKPDLLKHMREHNGPYPCPYEKCNKIFVDLTRKNKGSESLMQHINNVHEHAPCPYRGCCCRCKDKHSMIKKHIYLHASTYPCTYEGCCASYSSEKSLSAHYTNAHKPH